MCWTLPTTLNYKCEPDDEVQDYIAGFIAL